MASPCSAWPPRRPLTDACPSGGRREGRRTLPIGIIDKREISFDSRSLISVVKASLGRTAVIDLPATEPRGVFFDATNQRVVFSYSNEAHDVGVAGERLGVLLVSYCIRARIPLPRYSEKIARVEESRIIIICNTHYHDPPPVR